jgi:hypothetical protein
MNTEIRRFTNGDGEPMVAVETDIHFAEKDTMTTTRSSAEREFRAFIEAECPFMFDGSDDAGGVLDSDVATYEFLVAAMRDGLEDATREVAVQNRLDIREQADRRAAMVLLDQEDPTWSMARNFDELSSKAQTTVIRTAKQLANRLVLQRRNRGTAGGGRPKPMTDPYQAQRMERMEDIAHRNGHDLSTHAGRRAALEDVYAEFPHLRPRLARPGEHAQRVMPVARQTMGGYTLRRGQPPTGEPVGPPTNVAATVKPFAPVPHSEGTDGSGGVAGNLY